MTRNDFIQHFVVRLAPEPERVAEAVNRAAAVWDVLCGLGCVEAMPEPEPPPREGMIHAGTDWLGYPRRNEKPVGHSAMREATSNSSGVTSAIYLQQLDVNHWQKLVNANPGSTELQEILAASKAKLEALQTPTSI